MTDPNSQNLPEGTPTNTPSVFEPAPAPTNSVPVQPTAPLPADQTAPPTNLPPSAPIYSPGPPPSYGPPIADPSLNRPLVDTTGDFSYRVPRWRWFMSLLLIGIYPAMASLLSLFIRPSRRSKNESALPGTIDELTYYIVIDLAIFAVLWGLAWAFSRANKDELLLRWRGGAKPIALGFGYALGLRVAIMGIAFFALIVAVIVFMALGNDPKMLEQLIKDNSPKADTLFPKGALSNPIYLIFSTTVLSFVAAGFREELWRTSCLAALRHLLPDKLGTNARWITSIILSSVIFGLGHVYQGAVGVVVTGIIGLGLGIMTWRYRSIWPSVWAHGFFDATSFLLAAVVSSKGVATPPTWFGW